MAEPKILIGSGLWSNPDIWEPVGTPGLGDFVDATGNFDLTVDAVTARLGYFTRQASNGTLTINDGKKLDVGASCDLDGSVVGPGTIAVGGDLTLRPTATLDDTINILLDNEGWVLDDSQAGGGNYTINTLVSHQLHGDLYAHDVTLANCAGQFDMQDHGIIVDGSYVNNGIGSLSNPGTLTMTGTGNLNAGTTNYPAAVVVNGTVTLTGESHTKALSGTGDIALGAQTLCIYFPANNYWTFSGSITATTGSVKIEGSAYSNAALIDVGTASLVLFNSNLVDSAVFNGGLTCGDLALTSSDWFTTRFTILNLNASGDVTYGTAALNDSIILTLSGVCSVGSVGVTATNTGAAHALALGEGSYVITGGGTVDGTDVVVTANYAHVHDGTLEHLDEDGTGGTILRFGDSSGDNNNGNMTIVQCPAPAGMGRALMAA